MGSNTLPPTQLHLNEVVSGVACPLVVGGDVGDPVGGVGDNVGVRVGDALGDVVGCDVVGDEVGASVSDSVHVRSDVAVAGIVSVSPSRHVVSGEQEPNAVAVASESRNSVV